MIEKDFLELSEKELLNLADFIENNDRNSVFDVEYSDGILTIDVFDNNKTYIINKHSASQKIWLSSPISGADYFSYDPTKKTWLNDKTEELKTKLLSELTKNFNFNFLS